MIRPGVQRTGLLAVALLVVELAMRLVIGEPYLGSTALVLAACGLALLPWLPAALTSPSLRIALMPALALGSYAIVLTTISLVGVPINEVSIRLTAVLLVLAAVGGAWLVGPGSPTKTPWEPRSEFFAIAALAGIFAFSLAATWDIVDPSPPRGTDWGHYFLYAEEVGEQDALLIDNRFSAEGDVLFADPPAVGALYGSVLILDGVSSRSLGWGILLVSAFATLSVFALAAGLWGLGAGVLAAAAYAVSPVQLEPLYWHGLATIMALVFLPVAALALGFLYRGRGDARTVALLGFALIAVAAAHSTTAVVTAVFLGVCLLVDLVRWIVLERGRIVTALGRWWTPGILRPLLVACGIAVVAGAGVIAHLGAQSRDFGSPVSYRFFEPDWLDLDAVGSYFSWAFLAIAAVSAILVFSSSRLRRDPALLVLGALLVASVVVSQLWRIEFPFEYRRVVYSFGLGLAGLIGVASLRFTRAIWWIAAYGVMLAYVAHLSIGFRLPERLLSGSSQPSAGIAALDEFREKLDAGTLPETERVVTDRCIHFVVPYIVRRPSFAAFEEWQIGFKRLLPAARTATRILAGGAEGRRVAESLGIRYAVVDPRCSPGIAGRLGGTVVVDTADIVVVRIPLSKDSDYE